MAVYSVWDWNKLHYRYYETAEAANLGGWRPLTGLGIAGKTPEAGHVGMDIEAALPELPVNARFIGTGIQARGRIMRMPAMKPVKPFRSRNASALPQRRSLQGPEDGLLTEQLLPMILPKGKFNEEYIAAFLAGFAVARLFGKFKFALLAAGVGTAFLVGSKAKEKWVKP